MKGTLQIEQDRVRLGAYLWLSLQRTLRVPDDGNSYPLPVSLGRLPLFHADDLPAAPSEWRGHGALIVPLYQREALWLGFDAPSWRPCALKVGAGGINVITGEPMRPGLGVEPQDYLVCPPQLWLDGVNIGTAQVRQFVAMPLGLGVTVEGQLTGEEREGSIHVRLHEPRPGRFPESAPPADGPERLSLPQAGVGMGLAPGGRIRQRIYADPHGVGTWLPEPSATLTIHIIDSVAYESVTGRSPPPSPIDAETYRQRGLPWLDLYDEHMPAVPGSARLRGLKPASSGADDRDVPPIHRVEDGGHRRRHKNQK